MAQTAQQDELFPESNAAKPAAKTKAKAATKPAAKAAKPKTVATFKEVMNAQPVTKVRKPRAKVMRASDKSELVFLSAADQKKLRKLLNQI